MNSTISTTFFRAIVMLFVSLCFTFQLSAKITLASIFTDNMVLQQQAEAPLWGKAAPGKAVTVTTSWDKQVYKTTAAADGSWTLKVKTPAGSFNPYSISISDGKTVQLNNILIGEVWICSGQSNMEMPLADWGKVNNYEQEILNASYPAIRLLHISKSTSLHEQTDSNLENGGWKVCSPQSVPNFSAVAYFFGRDLLQNINMPIGLINVSWGGTVAEAWTSRESLLGMPDYKNALPEVLNLTPKQEEEYYVKLLAEWKQKVADADRGFKNGKFIWTDVNFEDSDWETMNVPGFWEAKGLRDVDGVVWFRKSITIPTDWKGKDLKVSLGAIDDNDVAFFNGVQIGATEGWDTPRVYTIPAQLVKEGKAVLTVKAIDNVGNGGFNGDPENMKIGLADNTVQISGDWKYKVGVDLREVSAVPPMSYNDPNRPTVLYNAMIHPLVPYAMRGAIWYQGEANENKAYQYRELFPLMITDWRKQWNSNFPFYYVQLANWQSVNEAPEDSRWAELREAQLKTLNLSNTGMAVAIEIGDAVDIHPKNKQEVGRRLALAARANTYNERVAYSGPIYDSYKMEGNTIRISFKHTDNGLKSKDNQPLKGFAIAGLDYKFYWATAVIDGNDVIVSAPEVSFPIAVRYGWANNPVCNLYNGAELPASPFRTDDWPGLTIGLK